jgi:hypothetical protein
MKEDARDTLDFELDLQRLRSSYFDSLSHVLDRVMRSAMFMSCVQCCLMAMNKSKSMESLSFDMLYQWDRTRRQWQSLPAARRQGDPR